MALKEFVNREIIPDAARNDEAGEPASIELYKKMGSFGWLASRIGPGAHLKGLLLGIVTDCVRIHTSRRRKIRRI